jgi:hypothetical protein
VPWGAIVYGLVFPPAFGFFLARFSRFLRGDIWTRMLGWWMFDAACTVVGGMIPPLEWWQSAAAAASGLIALFLWLWRRRRQLRRAVAGLGGKALVRLAALARGMRDAMPVPRPVLTPG